ncbi:MAG: hypothetical protein MUC50_14765 [Myxococcota bacterium]|jgi:hypothetical protein|nr:hypothetical protein [Myxococcota bacterium]
MATKKPSPQATRQRTKGAASSNNDPINGGSTDPEGVRQRAMQRMRKLVTASALGGLALGQSYCTDSMVCDPLPPGIECSEDMSASYLMEWMSWEAQWVNGTGGPVVSMTVNHHDVDGKLAFGSEPTLSGATLLSVEPTNSSLQFTCTVNENTDEVTATVPFTCDAIQTELLLRLNVSGERTVGSAIPISAE